MNKLQGDILCTPFDKRRSVMSKLLSIKVLGYAEDYYRFWNYPNWNYLNMCYFIRSDAIRSELMEALYK